MTSSLVAHVVFVLTLLFANKSCTEFAKAIEEPAPAPIRTSRDVAAAAAAVGGGAGGGSRASKNGAAAETGMIELPREDISVSPPALH